MKTWDGWHEGLAGRAKTMVKLIPRVGTNLVDLHHRLILVIPELTDTTIFSVSVTKPNRSQYNIQNKVCLNLNCARDQRNNIWIWSWDDRGIVWSFKKAKEEGERAVDKDFDEDAHEDDIQDVNCN